MDFFLTLYLIILGMFVVATVFIAGLDRKNMSRGDTENFVATGIMVGLWWPIVIAGLLVTAPFFAIYQLGKFIGSRQ